MRRLLLSLLAFLIYSNTFSVPFVLDDLPRIVENPKIRHLWWTFRDLSNSRTVGFFTFALNYRFGGLDLFGFHLINLLIHITNGFLVYSLIVLLFRASLVRLAPASLLRRSSFGCEGRKPDASVTFPLVSAPWVAFAAALLFIAHPLQTQAVTYIIQRFTSLSTLFYLLCVVGYLKWRLSPKETKSRLLWYGIALIATVLAMKTKEIAFTLPFMIFIVEAVFFWPLTGRRWASLIPFLLTLPVIPLSRLDGLKLTEAFLSESSKFPPSDYLFTQFRVIVTYLRLLLLPVQQNLDYDYPIYHSLFAPPVFVSFLFLVALFVLAVHLLRRTAQRSSPLNLQLRLIAFGILWFFLTLSSESSIIPIRDVIFEHRVYLPSVGIFLIAGVVWGLCVGQVRPLRGRGVIGFVPMGIIVLFFSVATYQRNRVWRDPIALWTDVTRKAPHRARGHNSLGLAYNDDKGHLEEAIQEYQTALRLDPNYFEAHNNLGLAYNDKGRLEEAIREYQIALRLNPDYGKAHNNLGAVYKAEGRLGEAIREYQIALQLNPDYVTARNNLGVAYKTQGRLEEAIREYQNALRVEPNLAETHYNLGLAYRNKDMLPEARNEFEQALRIKPGFLDARRALDSLTH